MCNKFSIIGLALIAFVIVENSRQCAALVRTTTTRRHTNDLMCNAPFLNKPVHWNTMHDNHPISQHRQCLFQRFAKPPEEEEGDDFWDQPFFDPDSYDDSDDSLEGKLASFVKSDYELAETLYAGILMVVCLVIAQEALRMQMYGDSYVPFLKGGAAGSGRLF